MSPDDAATNDSRRSGNRPHSVTRRDLLASTGGAGVMLLAGCSSQNDSDSDEAPTDGSTTDSGGSTESSGSNGPSNTESATGTFRLLVSDRPAAIDDFDSLEVSFERARVFKVESEDDSDEPSDADSVGTATGTATGTLTDTATATATPTATPTPTETATPTESEVDSTSDETEAESAAAESDDKEQGFTIIDLDGATVDLTRLLGPKASGVFTGELETGRYTKIELYAADVEGIVGGESVEVKIPSGKLMLTKSFEVTAGETVSFVFDINVVKKGQKASYNLLPVISESGVAGEDVEVEEVDSAEATGTSTVTTAPSDSAEEETASGDAATGTQNASASETNGQGQS